MQQLPMQNKLIKPLLSTLLGFIVLLAVVVGGLQIVWWGHNNQARLDQAAQPLVPQLVASLAANNASQLEPVLQQLESEPHILRAVVYDRLQRQVAQYAAAGQIDPQRLIFGGLRVHTYTVVLDNDARALGRLELVVSNQPLLSQLLQLGFVLMAAVVLYAALALALTNKAVKKMSNTVEQFTQEVGLIASAGQFDQRLSAVGDEPFEPLAGHINQLLDQLDAETRRRFDLERELKSLKHEAARSNEQAETAIQIKSQFLANMSHEIRTPMNGMLGMLDLLKDAPLSPQFQQYLGAAKTSTVSLLNTVNDILDLSKIEAGMLQLNPEPGSVREVLHEVARLYEGTGLEKGITLQLQIDPNLPESVRLDFYRLKQVVNNLVGNAFKFTKQGQITLSARKRMGPEHALAEISVQDTGIGIPSAALERLFEPFTQLDSSSVRSHGGSGLGLTMAKQLVQAMGGQLLARSQIGKGSVFTVELPLAGVATEAVDAAVGAAPNLRAQDSQSSALAHLKGMSILVAEDHAINQLLIKALLEKAGCHITLANNGLEAVRMAMTKRFDAILMDCQMPLVDGYQASQQIRAWEASQRIKNPVPILAVTALTLLGDRDKCIQAGMSGYLSKPFTALELYDALVEAQTT